MNKNVRSIGCVVAITLLVSAVSQGAEPSKSRAAFEQLASLVGEWRGVNGGTPITVTYTLTADGSALMEEFHPAGKPVMITMFSVDGDHLVATHYCSAGNQPQMATGSITDTQNNVLAFSLVRITGMITPDDWHNTGLEVHLEGKGHLSQNWTWEYRSKKGRTAFQFTRKTNVSVYRLDVTAGELYNCWCEWCGREGSRAEAGA